MKAPRQFLSDSFQDFRSNRKLQYGLLAIILIVSMELGIRWTESLDTKEKQLQQLRSEVRTLRNQSRDEDALRRLLSALETSQQTVDKRLWVVSSDAVGQAQLKDWMTKLVQKAGVKNFKLTLSSPRPLGQTDRSEPSEGATAGAGSRNTIGKNFLKDMRELRASLTMPFAPDTLEKVLLEIEGGEPLAVVEFLNVKRQDRRAELGVRILMRIGTVEQKGADSSMAAEPSSEDKHIPEEGMTEEVERTKPLPGVSETPVTGT